MEKRLSQYYFTSQEHVTSSKVNAILAIEEERRKMSGPISISAAASGSFNATGYDIALAEPMRDLGGAITSGGNTVTRPQFMIIYYSPSDTVDDANYVRWKDVHFVSGGDAWGDEWYARLSNTVNMTYGYLDSGAVGDGAGQVDLSGVAISGFSCWRQSELLYSGYDG